MEFLAQVVPVKLWPLLLEVIKGLGAAGMCIVLWYFSLKEIRQERQRGDYFVDQTEDAKAREKRLGDLLDAVLEAIQANTKTTTELNTYLRVKNGKPPTDSG